jgi:hypothetical protein
MVLRVLVFLLLGQIHAYCAKCAWHMLTQGYYFLCNGDDLYALRILLYQIALRRPYCMCCFYELVYPTRVIVLRFLCQLLTYCVSRAESYLQTGFPE